MNHTVWTGRRLAAAALLVTWSATAVSLQSPALQLAKRVDEHYNRLHSLRVHFTQSYDGMGMHRVESGTLLLAKGGRFHDGRMRWTYEEPAGKLFIFDGKNAFFYTPGQSEVQRIPATQLSDLRSPLALLLGHADLPKQLEDLTLQGGPGGHSILSGVPRGLRNRVVHLRLEVNSSGAIDRMTIEDQDGSRNTFTFSGEQPDIPAPASAFQFTPPPGTHIVEGIRPL